MTDSFRDLVETISRLAEKDELSDRDNYTCPLCDENPCVCDQDRTESNKTDQEKELEETVSAQRLAQSFSDNQAELPYAIKVFLKLKSGEADSLNNNERLESAKILKMLIPTISEDDLFSRINNDMLSRNKAAHDAQTAPTPGAAPTAPTP